MNLKKPHSFTVFILLTVLGLSNFANAAGVACSTAADIKPEADMSVEAKQKFPEAAQNLDIIFSHQTRTFKEKQRDYLVFEMDASKVNDPAYIKFQEESIEIIIVVTTGGSFRHIVMRVGDQVFDYGNLQHGRTGQAFRLPSAGKDVKGAVFMVGREKIKEALKDITAFYEGNVKYNNPPFSSVGGKLVIESNPQGGMKFTSKEKVWIPGGKTVNIENLRNNRPFKGELVTVKTENGREKTVLQNPDGVQIPAGMGEDGVPFVNGFSCASSATFVFKKYLGLELFDSKSAANLMKKLIEGNNGFTATPDAIVLYGPERYPAKVPFESATLDRSKLVIEKKAEPAVLPSAEPEAPAPIIRQMPRRQPPPPQAGFGATLRRWLVGD